MGALEQGRNILRYSVKTAEKASGIAEFKRQQKDVISGGDQDEAILAPLAYGLTQFLMPRYSNATHSNDHKDLGWLKLRYLPIDLVVVFLAGSMVSTGNYLEAAVYKLGYNTILEIAPDVANLAKRNIFQRTKPKGTV